MRWQRWLAEAALWLLVAAALTGDFAELLA